MKGIEQGYELPLEAPPSMTGFTEHGGLIDQAQLPQSLDEALDEMGYAILSQTRWATICSAGFFETSDENGTTTSSSNAIRT